MIKIINYFNGVREQFFRKKLEISISSTIPIIIANEMESFFRIEFPQANVKAKDFIIDVKFRTVIDPSSIIPSQYVDDASIDFSNNFKVEMIKHYPEFLI